MIIVAGHLIVDPDERDAYLASCVTIIEQARRAPGCLDYAVGADLLEPGRINVFERWVSQQAVESFRADGPSEEQAAALRSAAVTEYDIADSRRLT